MKKNGHTYVALMMAAVLSLTLTGCNGTLPWQGDLKTLLEEKMPETKADMTAIYESSQAFVIEVSENDVVAINKKIFEAYDYLNRGSTYLNTQGFYSDGVVHCYERADALFREAQTDIRAIQDKNELVGEYRVLYQEWSQNYVTGLDYVLVVVEALLLYPEEYGYNPNKSEADFQALVAENQRLSQDYFQKSSTARDTLKGMLNIEIEEPQMAAEEAPPA